MMRINLHGTEPFAIVKVRCFHVLQYMFLQTIQNQPSRPFYSTYHSISFYTVSNWIIGNKNEACQSVCAKTGRVCNSQEQSKITTKDLFEDAMKKAGHRSCQKFVQRDYSGVPLIANDGKTCVYLNWGAKSVCDDVKYDDHSPICYCGKFF